jgi:hypothetical protein
MEHFKSIRKQYGVDVGYHSSNIHPSNGEGCVGARGIDKNYSLVQVIELAYKMEEKPKIPKLSSSMCIIEIFKFLSRKELLEMNLLNKKIYNYIVPMCYPNKTCVLWVPLSAYLMFPEDRIFEI